jgi:hypothetical protein
VEKSKIWRNVKNVNGKKDALQTLGKLGGSFGKEEKFGRKTTPKK